jgi:Co/Zn/Cd efflux system component
MRFQWKFEFTAGIFTNSLALITDSTHALLDAVVTAILIIAVRLALKPKDVYDCHLVLSLL